MNFRQNWKVLALYTLLTGVFTYPVVLHLNSRIMGDGDAWRFYWNMWRMRFSLLQLINPFCSDYIHFPTGACAYLHTWNFPVTARFNPTPKFLLNGESLQSGGFAELCTGGIWDVQTGSFFGDRPSRGRGRGE